MRTTKKEKPYQCLFCDKAVESSSDRPRHEIANHTKSFPHACEICKKGFLSPKQLKEPVKKLH